MKTYQVLVRAEVEIMATVNAESEEEARDLAGEVVDDLDCFEGDVSYAAVSDVFVTEADTNE